MSPSRLMLGLALALGPGCALLPEQSPPVADPDDLAAFVETVREAMEMHEWQTLLSASDPALYQERVVEGGIEEVQYLADLLGLARPGNSIQEGDELDWEDLDRVTEVALAPAAGQGPTHRITGFVLTEGGGELDVETWVTDVQGRLVLTAN